MPQIIASTASTQWQLATLTDAEQEEITKEFHCYPDRKSVCIEALKIVQSHRGWVSDDAVDAIAAFLEMSPAEVDGVATFYNLIYRQPVGNKVILLCDSVSCWMMGCNSLKDAIKNKLDIDYGQTSADGEYTLLPVPCLGDCDHAPAMMINRNHYGNVTEEKLDKILKEERSN